MTITSRQGSMMRHALGLDNTAGTRSYRNRYYVAIGTVDHALWVDLADDGLALISEPAGPGRLVTFRLTRKGAEMVLDEGESLCPEDFPNVQ